MVEAKKRLERYPNVDGSLEVMLGSYYLLVGLGPLLVRFEWPLKVLPVIILLLFFGLLFFKHRVTYPQTGSAMPRAPSSYTLGTFVVAAGMMFSRRLLPEDSSLLNQGYPVFFAASLAIFILLLGRGLERFYLYAGVALTAGIGATLLGLGQDAAVSAVALPTGLALLVFGFRTLRRYLREHPQAQ